MNDGWYRVIPKEGTSYEILGVEDDIVADDESVEEWLELGYTFTRVYPVHLPDEMWEDIHSEALSTGLSDDDIVEHAIRNFFIHFRPAPEYRKKVKDEN